MATLQPPDYAAHVARMDAERARQHLAAWGVPLDGQGRPVAAEQRAKR